MSVLHVENKYIENADGQIEKAIKVTTPVTNRRDYLALRAEAYQKGMLNAYRKAKKKDAKLKLKQFAYNILQNEAGTLAGQHPLSSTIAMDIDHIPIERLDEVIARLTEVIPDLKIMLIEVSAKGRDYPETGIHIVFQRDYLKTPEENLQWASEVIAIEGVEYDKNAKDDNRVMFATTDSQEDLIYLDDRLFDMVEVPRIDVKPTQTVKTENTPQSSSKTYPDSYKGISFKDIIAEYWRLSGGEPQEGERNTQLHKLAVHLRGICDNNPEWLQQIMPDYGLPDYEFKRTLASACGEPPKDITKKMKSILQALQPKTKKEAPALPVKLPRIIELALQPFPKIYWPQLALVAVLMLGVTAMRHRTLYVDNREIAPNLYFTLIGESGGCKSFVQDLVKMFTRITLQINDDEEWAKLFANQEARSGKENAKDKPKKYHPRFYINETMSCSSMIDNQLQLGDYDIQFSNFAEADQLFTMKSKTWSDLSVLLRKGFDGEMHRQYYFSDQSVSAQVKMLCALILTGTPQAIMSRLFSNTEDGLLRRFMVVTMKDSGEIRTPPFNPLDSDNLEEFNDLVTGLWAKTQSIETTKTLALPKTQKLVTDWLEEKNQLYQDGELTDGEADLTHRIGQHMMRSSLALCALYEEESKVILNLVKWIGDYTYYHLCRLFALRVQKDKDNARQLMNTDSRKTVLPILQQMSQIFTKQEFVSERKRLGQSPDVKKTLQRYCKQGKIRKIGNGVYEKQG